MYILLLITIVTGFIFALTALAGYFITGRKYKYMEQAGESLGLTAKRGFLFLLPVLKGSFNGFKVTAGYIPGTTSSPSYYNYKVFFSPPLNDSFTFYKNSVLDFRSRDSDTTFENRFRIFRDKNGAVLKISRNRELTDMLMDISKDSNIHSLLFTGKMVYLSVFERKEQTREPGYYLTIITAICKKMEFVLKSR